MTKMAAIIEASNKFALELHKTLRAQERFSRANLFYSPSSLSVALGMTHLGARENTATEMATVFHWDKLSTEDVHGEMRQFLQTVQAANSANTEISTANRLFLQKDFNILQQFKDEVLKFYEADVPLVDYKTDPESVREVINKWVEEKTKEKIKNLIASGVLTSRTRLTLVNAIYFKGAWHSEFKKENTRSSPFFVTPAQEVNVKMMNSTAKFKYYEDEALKCQMLELPYDGQDLSMVFLLPFDTHGLTELEGSLTYDKLQNAVNCLDKAHLSEVEVSIPKFKLTQEFQLKEILGQMGINDMFDEFKADFSGIVTPGGEKLYVSHVIHKAFVDVNEKGTEAAAATAVVMKARKAVRHPTFCADHPFLFLIRHNKSNAIVFLGSLVSPDKCTK